ncbi:MAG: sulfate permease [Immundisolibacter sp.]|uniref:SulP family inorganic anion transporter n=1 Tax=Immundisolibacter sp. TaxID=1934948 RepID=UPI0019C5BB12|nr:sulfate permease [Immundisolibacter sp.]MBC7162654.1 sulfate permease [Immundisolibacter sp.]
MPSVTTALPLLRWLRTYRRTDAGADLLAGIITAVLLVPQAMAYAVVAGLPPQVGLYASVLPSLAYALFGTSPYLGVGPVAVNALMVASALAVVGHGDPAEQIVNAQVLAAISALTLLGLGALRAGAFMSFLSRPVLDGFTSGAALLIVLTQLPALLGLSAGNGPLLHEVLPAVWRALPMVDWPTLTLAMASLGLLILGGRPLRGLLGRLPLSSLQADLLTRLTPLVVLAVASIVATSGDLAMRGVAVVGVIPVGLPAPSFAFLRASTWLELLAPGMLIALISYVSSVSIAQGLASRRRERVDTDQELYALGAANAASAIGGALPVAASFSRSALNFSAGARTPLAGVVSALLVGCIALWLSGLFHHLPRAALAALIVMAVAPLIDLHGFRCTWAYSRSDGLSFGVTFVAVLFLGVERGLLLGALLGVAMYVWRTGRPHIAVVGRVPGSEHFRNVNRYHVETWPNLLLLRVDESLYFANASRVEEVILNQIAASPLVTELVLIGSGINHVDSTGRAMLETLLPALREAGVCTHLAEFKGPVLDRLKSSGLLDTLAPGRVFLSAEQAVTALAEPYDEPVSI